MLIASKFKRPKAPIEMADGTVYYFTPVNAADPESEHVCEVENLEHIQSLLSITEGYHISTQDPATKKVAQKPAVPTKTPPTGTGTQPPAGGQAPAPNDPPVPPAAPTTEEITKSAEELLELTWQAIQGRIGKDEVPRAVIEEALRIEETKPEDDQRASIIKQLKKGLET